MEKQWKRAEQQFEKALVCLPTIEQSHRVQERVLLWDYQSRDLRGNSAARDRVPRYKLFGVLVGNIAQWPVGSTRRVIPTFLVLEISVQIVRSLESRFGDETDHQRQGCAQKDGHEIKGPLPAERLGDFSDKHGCQEGGSKQGDIGNSHSLSSFLQGG